MKIISLNVNAWKHTLSREKFGDRLPDIAAYIKKAKPDICCLQELLAGRNGVFVDQLSRELPGYEIVVIAIKR